MYKQQNKYEYQAGLWIKINMKPFPNDETLAIAQQTVVKEFMSIMDAEDVDFDEYSLNIVFYPGGLVDHVIYPEDKRSKRLQLFSTIGIKAMVSKECSINLKEGEAPNPHGELNL